MTVAQRVEDELQLAPGSRDAADVAATAVGDPLPQHPDRRACRDAFDRLDRGPTDQTGALLGDPSPVDVGVGLVGIVARAAQADLQNCGSARPTAPFWALWAPHGTGCSGRGTRYGDGEQAVACDRKCPHGVVYGTERPIDRLRKPIPNRAKPQKPARLASTLCHLGLLACALGGRDFVKVSTSRLHGRSVDKDRVTVEYLL